jgi:beta-1,3-N-acetylgalactosaminyltransferase 2
VEFLPRQPVAKDIDILLLGAKHAKVHPVHDKVYRLIMNKRIKGMVLEQAGYAELDNDRNGLWLKKYRGRYISLIQRAKIVVFDSSVHQNKLRNYGQVGLAGTAIAANVPLMHPEMAEFVLQLDLHDSEDVITKKLNLLVSNLALLEHYSRKAQKFAMNNFRCSRKVDEMLDAYAHYQKGSRGLLHATASELSAAGAIHPHVTSSKLAILALSRRDAFEERAAIRQTWGNGHDNVYFIVGRSCPIPPTFRKPWTCEAKNTSIENSDIQWRWSLQAQAIDKKILEEGQKYGDMLLVDDIDVYRHLPHKLKSAYAWAAQHTDVEWFCKIDVDSFIRVSTLEHYLRTNYDSKSYTIIAAGFQERWPVHRGGKNGEYQEFKGVIYPQWPIGSGHIVTRSIAMYVVNNRDKLFNYQGEDVSLGIWLDQSPFKSEIQWSTSGHIISHSGNCYYKSGWIIGESISPQKMRSCYKFMDEAAHLSANFRK